MPKDRQNICDELKSTMVCHVESSGSQDILRTYTFRDFATQLHVSFDIPFFHLTVSVVVLMLDIIQKLSRLLCEHVVA